MATGVVMSRFKITHRHLEQVLLEPAICHEEVPLVASRVAPAADNTHIHVRRLECEEITPKGRVQTAAHIRVIGVATALSTFDSVNGGSARRKVRSRPSMGLPGVHNLSEGLLWRHRASWGGTRSESAGNAKRKLKTTQHHRSHAKKKRSIHASVFQHGTITAPRFLGRKV